MREGSSSSLLSMTLLLKFRTSSLRSCLVFSFLVLVRFLSAADCVSHFHIYHFRDVRFTFNIWTFHSGCTRLAFSHSRKPPPPLAFLPSEDSDSSTPSRFVFFDSTISSDSRGTHFLPSLGSSAAAVCSDRFGCAAPRRRTLGTVAVYLGVI